MPRKPLTVKYVLYSHYFFEEENDFQAFRAQVHPADFQGVIRLTKYFGGLEELLDTPGFEGVLVLFYARGFIDFLDGIGRRENREQLLSRSQDLGFAKAVSEHVSALLGHAGLSQRVRILTSLDLYDILGSTHTTLAENYREFITGAAPQLRYDAPKIVEAILRLRLLGTGIPVLRLDQDVIFREDNHDGSGSSDLGLFKGVVCSVQAYRLRLKQASVADFMFSASYDSRAVREEPLERTRFEAWSGAFATRVYPAVLARPKLVRKICDSPPDRQEKLWSGYLRRYTDDALALRFYGLKRGADGLEADGLSGIALLGAPPLAAVISGALLCLSDGAILDLPPFSNFGHNVTWIDDHLKYSLHRAMSNFASRERLRSDPGLSSAQLKKVFVVKDRPRNSNLPHYVFNSYLPTLLWGTIVDSWINADPNVKCQKGDETDGEQPDAARGAPMAGILPRWLSVALRSGDPLPSNDQRRMREELLERAITRINEVRACWSALRGDSLPTFASAWATGTVRDDFAECLGSPGEDDLWEGIAPGYAEVERVKEQQLSGSMRVKLRELVEDAIQYVAWTVEWPKFVQIVRSAPQGSFVGDLSWFHPTAADEELTRSARAPGPQEELAL